MQRKSLLYYLLAFLTCLLVVWISPSSVAQSVSALRPESSAEKVYLAFPNLPKNNDYKKVENGALNTESTLISRLIRYHQDVKKRPTDFRVDWLLTMADYLGVNEPIKSGQYPGYLTLQTNPMQDDIKIIRSLTRDQRRSLVDFLVTLYAPALEKPTTKPSVSPDSNNTPSKPGLSKPGDAKFLMP
jgi:hypothetical protein